MRSNDDGLPRLPRACNSVPQQPPCHGVHPSRRLIQEDDRRPTDQSHACTQLPLVSTTACVEGYWAAQNTVLVKLMPTGENEEWHRFVFVHSGLTCSYGPVYQHEAPAAATSGHSPHSQTHTSREYLWVWHTCSEFLFLSCGPTQHQTEGSNQCAAAPAIQR